MIHYTRHECWAMPPRTGSNSIITRIRELSDREDLLDGWHHSPLSAYSNLSGDWLKFCTYRDPAERLASVFNYILMQDSAYQQALAVDRMTFHQWVETALELVDSIKEIPLWPHCNFLMGVAHFAMWVAPCSLWAAGEIHTKCLVSFDVVKGVTPDGRVIKVLDGMMRCNSSKGSKIALPPSLRCEVERIYKDDLDALSDLTQCIPTLTP